jgi:hypothetical protein
MDKADEFEEKLMDLLDEYLGKKLITYDDAIGTLEMRVMALKKESAEE